MSLFNTNLLTLARQLVPVVLHTSPLGAWIEAIGNELESLRTAFLQRRTVDRAELRMTGQVCKLEGLLNDTFDPVQRRIYIEDANPAEPLWIRRRAEAQPVYLYTRAEVNPVFIYTRPETEYGAMFTVRVPSSLIFDPVRMKALVAKYRIPSSVFTIKTF